MSLISAKVCTFINCSDSSDKKKTFKTARKDRMKTLSTRFKKYRERDQEFLNARKTEIHNLVKDFGMNDFMLLREILDKKEVYDVQDDDDFGNDFGDDKGDEFGDDKGDDFDLPKAELVRDELVRDDYIRDE